MSQTERQLKALFTEQGELAQRFSGFKPRIQQEQLALDIHHAIENKTNLIAEAGTGTGKTLAYLIPALLSGKKTLVSTGTKTLQDQLISRDIPRLRECLSLPARVALLKGRANYLCLHALDNHSVDADFFGDHLTAQYTFIQEWAKRTTRGDIAELDDIPEDSSIWSTVTSTAESCLGAECSHFEDCFLVKARKQALAADMVIINHHLFFADLQLKQNGFSELLPDVDTVIFDEAHQLPEVASQWFGERISSRQLQLLIADCETVLKAHAEECLADFTLATEFHQLLKECRNTLPLEPMKSNWSELEKNELFLAHCSSIHFLLGECANFLLPLVGRHGELVRLYERVIEMQQQWIRLTKPTQGQTIAWYETTRSGVTIHHTPMSVAEKFKAMMTRFPASWIFCSATLAVDHDFTHFASQLGLENAPCSYYDSPFDYAKQALTYVPRNIPDPKHRNYIASIVAEVTPVIQAARGRTLFLFTSYRAMEEAGILLAQAIDFPILIQGTRPKQQLLTEFIVAGNAVLLATASFWEGVDIRGDDLVCVIIDKLPFASPNDPVLQERLKNYKIQGKDPFYDYQLPSAVMSLRQGVGRLIRSVEDKGVVVLADPRLCARDYASYFWNSLPPMPITRDFQVVKAFLT